MRYERQFNAMERDASKRKAMLADLREIAKMLEDGMDDEEHGSICADLTRLTKRIAYHLLRKHRETKKEVSSTMGGKILELHSEKMFRMGEAKGEAKGEARGKAKGKAEGIAEGIAKGEGRLSRLISLLVKSGKTDEIVAATENEEIRKELYAKYGIA